jgi:hypothetical protein
MNHTTTTRCQLPRLYISLCWHSRYHCAMHVTRALPSQCHAVAATCCCKHIPQHTPGKATPQKGMACIHVLHITAGVLRGCLHRLLQLGACIHRHPPHCHHTHCAPSCLVCCVADTTTAMYNKRAAAYCPQRSSQVSGHMPRAHQ